MRNQLDRVPRHIKNHVLKKYGFMPRITNYKGKIYISDPTAPSEPWEEFTDEKDLIRKMRKT